MKDCSSEFKKSIKYRNASLLLLFSIPITMGIMNEIMKLFNLTNDTVLKIGVFTGACILLISIFFMTKFKCPNCKTLFEVNHSISELNYCPNCGVKLS